MVCAMWDGKRALALASNRSLRLCLEELNARKSSSKLDSSLSQSLFYIFSLLVSHKLFL